MSERVRVKERCSDRCPSSAVYAGAFGAQVKRRDELRRRQASAVTNWREQQKASLVVARRVCAAQERVLGDGVVCCVVGDGNAGMLATWCVQVGRNQALDCMA
jgi:hypothetical protein